MDISIKQIIKDWSENPQKSADRLLDYYGEPDEYSDSQLIWYDTDDGWKRTVLRNEEIPHKFPAPHTDYLEQFIDYRVPVEMYSKLAEFDGSVIAERTKGEMSARCGGTSMNFVAINLAHDIITETLSVQDAREEYARLYKAFQEGERPPYTREFHFDIPANTGDPDTQIEIATEQ